MNWQVLAQIYLNQRELRLVCAAIDVQIQACEKANKFAEADEWRTIAAKLYCAGKEFR